MLNSGLLYLAEASFCLAAFALAYRALLAGLTAFAWNRAYLLGALGAGAVLPFVAFPGLAGLLAPMAGPAAPTQPPFQLSWQAAPLGTVAQAAAPAFDVVGLFLLALAVVYGLGALCKLLGTGRNLWALRCLAQRHPRTKQVGFSIVHLPAPGLPAFSFGRLVFLSPQHEALRAAERQQLLQHEQVHVRQRHTLDLLLAEALGVLFWFNPAVPYLGRQLKAVHEFLADEAVARTQASPVGYGQLLIKLACQQPPFALVHAFANKQIVQRIRMLTQPTSTPMQKLRFLLVVPVFALVWAATACAGAPTTAEPSAPAPPTASAGAFYTDATQGRIGRISWQGNTFLSTAELNQALGLKTGDAYDSLEVARRLSFGTAGGDISSRYMDHGYLFFAVSPAATRQPDGSTDLAFTINEGRKAQLGTVTLVKNGLAATPTPQGQALLKRLPLHSGEEFSRSKLIEAQRLLAREVPLDASKIGINPRPVMRPNMATDLVDIEIVLADNARH